MGACIPRICWIQGWLSCWKNGAQPCKISSHCSDGLSEIHGFFMSVIFHLLLSDDRGEDVTKTKKKLSIRHCYKMACEKV